MTWTKFPVLCIPEDGPEVDKFDANCAMMLWAIEKARRPDQSKWKKTVNECAKKTAIGSLSDLTHVQTKSSFNPNPFSHLHCTPTSQLMFPIPIYNITPYAPLTHTNQPQFFHKKVLFMLTEIFKYFSLSFYITDIKSTFTTITLHK